MRRSLFFSLLGLLVACGSDDEPSGPPSAGQSGAAGKGGAAGKAGASQGGAGSAGGPLAGQGGQPTAGQGGAAAAGQGGAGQGGKGGQGAGQGGGGQAGAGQAGAGVAGSGQAGAGAAGSGQGGSGQAGSGQAGAGTAGAGAGGSGGAVSLPDTPMGQLQALPPPVFKEGHTLPPLTWASCTWTSPEGFAFETALVEKYGYAYSLHRAEKYWNDLLDNPSSDVAQKVAKNKQDPQRYRLATTTIRPLWSQEEGLELPYKDYLTQDLPARCPGCSPSLLTADSKPPGSAVFSPAADPKFYDMVGDDVAKALAPYKAKNIPLSIVFDLAEDGIGISQGNCHGGHWGSDPAVQADIQAFLGVASAPACDTKGWAQYASSRIGRAQKRVADKIKAALPAGAIYVRYRTEGNLNRERYGSWYDWAPWYEDTKDSSMLPNMSAYYAGDEPPYLYWDKAAWDDKTDMLTGTLASVAFQIKSGSPLSYNSVSGGWPTGTKTDVSPIDRYTGYLKALYVAGNLGAIASWWSPGLWQKPDGGWSCDPDVKLAAAQVPDGLAQMLALGEVHALFSHLEEFLRQGSLVPGPGVHRFTADKKPESQIPAYELLCGETAPSGAKVCDRARRVLARKHDQKQEWIVLGFAASGGDQQVQVDLPGAGSIPVLCRAAGALHRVTLEAGQPKVSLIDADPLHPTAQLSP